ncbi:MAG: hypothetical protein H7X95_10060, partial [Deltaproteobacteria bacterium]|nr:hypothetical protein [Deltaproteobacteria bacterium]
MTRRGPGPVIRLALVCIAVLLPSVTEGVASAETVTVDLLAPRGSRLAEDLRRELGASGFVVVYVEATTGGGDWEMDVRRLPGNQSRRGVVVWTGEERMTVFTRMGASDTIKTHFEQHVGPSRDRLARRRACLGAVEYLRVLSETVPNSVDPAPGLGTIGVPVASLSKAPPSENGRPPAASSLVPDPRPGIPPTGTAAAISNNVDAPDGRTVAPPGSAGGAEGKAAPARTSASSKGEGAAAAGAGTLPPGADGNITGVPA